MEKRGVIKAGITPAEKETQSKSQEKRLKVQQLDSDFRKRAADAARQSNQ